MPAIRYREVLLEKGLRDGRVYKEVVLKGVFTEGLHESVRFSTQTYCGARTDATLQSLTRCTTSLFKLNEGTKSISTPTRSSRYDPHKSAKS